MSSLAAARADNYYYPKDWQPADGSLNKYHGSHALGKRAKDLATDGVLVVRFEMPFNVWCAHCHAHIGRGVRFNARKKKIGMYFTTIRYEFRLKHAECGGEMVIETDPENRNYKLVSGLTKQTTVVDEHDVDDRGVEYLNDPHVGIQTADDPFYQLEHEQQDRVRAKVRARGLEAVVNIQNKQFKDDYASNAALRAGFRQKKRHLQSNAQRADALGLGIPLLDAVEEDVERSKATVFQGIQGKKRKSVEDKTRSRTPKREDTFQFFGDDKASKLHQLKKKKLEQTKVQRPESMTTRRVLSVHARAKNLLTRR